MAAANTNFDAILSTTLNSYRNQFINNIFTSRPLLNQLKKKGKIENRSGGAQIVEQLMYGLNGTFSSYSMYDAISLTAQEGLSSAQFPWKQAAVTVAIAGLEEAENSGKAEMVSLLNAKVTQATETASEKFDQMFFGDGTGNSGKDMLGLAALVTASGTVGGIDSGTWTFWQSAVTAGAGARDDSEWATTINNASKTGAGPDFGVTTQTLYESYEASLAPQERYSMTDSSADARPFENLMFKRVPLYWDVYCTAGVTYFLNTDNLKFVYLGDRFMKNLGFNMESGTDARYAHLVTAGNLVVNNRARQGKVTGQSA